MFLTKSPGIRARAKFALGGAFLALIGLLVWKVFFASNSLEEDARRVMACQQTTDAGCLIEYMLPEEVKAQGITRDKLQRLLVDYIRPAYGGLLDQKPTSQLGEPSRESGSYHYTVRWVRSNRPTAVMGSGVFATRAGAKAAMLVRNMIFLAMLTKYRRSNDEHQILSWIRGFRADAQELRSLGFDGLYNPAKKEVETWEVLYADSIRKARTHGIIE
jgi:hypothetical protein